MKKMFTAIVTLNFFSASVFAETDLKNYTQENNDKNLTKVLNQNTDKPLNSWFISAGIGAQIYFGDHDKQLSTGKRITPAFEVSGGKWFNGYFGSRVNIQLAKMKGLTQHGDYNGLSTGVKFRDVDDLWYQKFTYIQYHVDFLYNWTDDAFGIDSNRGYNLIPYLGVGLISVLDKQKGTSFSPNLGLLNTININKQFGINIDVKGSVIRDKVDGEIGGRNLDGTLSATIGINYYFK